MTMHPRVVMYWKKRFAVRYWSPMMPRFFVYLGKWHAFYDHYEGDK